MNYNATMEMSNNLSIQTTHTQTHKHTHTHAHDKVRNEILLKLLN